MRLQIDKEVYKIRDDKVRRLLTGALSVDAFALLIRPSDPYILIGDTIYALTEQEFYAIRYSMPRTELSENAFKYVLGLQDLSFMHEMDRNFVHNVAANAGRCSACQYRHYKDDISKLVKKYNIRLPDDNVVTDVKPVQYPPVSTRVTSKVSELLEHMYKMPKKERRACVDCVEKHIAQAWVLSREFLNGYPEYITYVIGHLGEALDEMPKGFPEIFHTVEFCLAKTNHDRVPFVPVELITPLITMVRNAQGQSHEDQQDIDDTASAFEIEFTQEMHDEMSKLPSDVFGRFGRMCYEADKFIHGVENLTESARLGWEGAMGSAADLIVDFAPKTASMLRNRRLMFVSNPLYAAEAGYTMMAIADSLAQCDGA